MYRVAKLYPLERKNGIDSVPYVDVIEVNSLRAAKEYAKIQNTEYASRPDLRGNAPVFKDDDGWHSPDPTSPAHADPSEFLTVKFVAYHVNPQKYSIRAVMRGVNIDPNTGLHMDSPIFTYPSYDYIPLEVAKALCDYWNDTHPVAGFTGVNEPVVMTYFPMQPVV